MHALKDIFVEQLQDLYSANKQSAALTERLRDAAGDDALRAALDRGASGIRDGMRDIEGIARRHGVEPTGEHCLGMQGLVKEAEAHALEEDYDDAALRDAVIIAQYQRMAHYAIAGYGTLAAFARRLKLEEDEKVLRHCLETCYGGDRTMTEIAEGGVNQAAT